MSNPQTSGSGVAPGLPIVAYHFLTSQGREYRFASDEKRYVVDRALFVSHLEALTAAGYGGRDLAEAPVGAGTVARPVAITFDDGHVSGLEIALEELVRRQRTAAFFIPTDFIGRPQRLAEQDLRELHQAGMVIGSHGCSHRPLTALSPTQAAEELRRSKDVLEQIVGASVSLLSLPHGFGSRSLERTAREAGYTAVCNSRIGLNGSGCSSFRFSRVTIDNSISGDKLVALLQPGSAAHLQAVVVDRAKAVGKWVLQTHRRCD